MQLLRAADRIATPWKNGGGRLWEVAAHPAAAKFDFEWRVSLAEVKSDGPFSVFPHTDRILVVLEGKMVLTVGERAPVGLHADCGPLAFPGDVSCYAEVVEPVLGLNVMIRRGGLSAEVALQPANSLVKRAATTLMVALEAGFCGPYHLERLDAVRIDPNSGVTAPTLEILTPMCVIELT